MSLASTILRTSGLAIESLGEREAFTKPGWEDDYPGIGYASCTPIPGGGFELYMWSDQSKTEVRTFVETEREDRALWSAFQIEDEYAYEAPRALDLIAY